MRVSGWVSESKWCDDSGRVYDALFLCDPTGGVSCDCHVTPLVRCIM